jgi:hypothetical protein
VLLVSSAIGGTCLVITTVIGEGDESRESRALVRGCGCIRGIKGKYATSIVTSINRRK